MDYIPHFQPIPFPAPVWFLKTLLVIGFYLHALPMNIALMGGFVAGAFVLYGRVKNNGNACRLGHTLGMAIPFFVSLAITQGILPLLFLQLTYGPLFYTSSILIAVPWLAVIGLLLMGYSCYYLYFYQHRKLGRWGIALPIVASTLLLGIAFAFSNNMTLMLTPQRWLGLYAMSPHGLNLNWAEPQLIPRYLHFLVGAIAVVALTIGCFGWYWQHRGDADYSRWLLQTGAKLFMSVTLLQVPIGIWFLLSLPSAVRWRFLGADMADTAVFIAAMLLDIVSLSAMGITIRHGSLKAFQLGLSAALTVIFLMVLIRHLVREAYVQGFFYPQTVPVHPQWIMLTLFSLTLLALILYFIWLLKVLWRGFHAPEPPSSAPAVEG